MKKKNLDCLRLAFAMFTSFPDAKVDPNNNKNDRTGDCNGYAYSLERASDSGADWIREATSFKKFRANARTHTHTQKG